TPGGAFVNLDVKFQDGSEEIYGGTKTNPDGSGMGGGIAIPTLFGPHMATNSTTILGNHTLPQAGITIYNDKIYLLASTGTQTFQQADSPSALKISMSTDSDIINPGQAIRIIISVNNTLGNSVDIISGNNWLDPNVVTEPCSTEEYGVAILDGFYDFSNVTQGKNLDLFNYDLNCPSIQKTAMAYEFQPQSGNVTTVQCKPIVGTKCPDGPRQMGQDYTFRGYYDNGNVQPFKPGMYTVAGADEWGHVAIEHFVVSNSTIFAGDLGSMSCPVIIGGGEADATIKNATGFANFYNSTDHGNTFLLHLGMQGMINVQYKYPANTGWFQGNDTTSVNINNGAALYYMENITEGKSIVSYAVSLYNDETGHHSTICHYNGLPRGGFTEPCNSDNTGNIAPGELPYASSVLHVGIDTSVQPNSAILTPTDTSSSFTTTVSAKSDAMPGVYWLALEKSLCGPGVLAKLVVLP
ncbi:MAG: hypothetical protein ACREAT_06210, partial [Nitrosotalea sp.]